MRERALCASKVEAVHLFVPILHRGPFGKVKFDRLQNQKT